MPPDTLPGAAAIQPMPPLRAPFSHLASLWIQVTGTWCNLTCTHCFNSSGPRDPWLPSLDAGTVLRAIREAEELGVKEIYFTGGEPFLHREMLAFLEASLAVVPTTVLTNGTLIREASADRLAALAAGSRYSLEMRVSIDDVDPAANDRIRGKGAFAKAMRAIRLLTERGLLPIVSASEIGMAGVPTDPEQGMYARLRRMLIEHGVAKPRIKLIPVFRMGRLEPPGELPLLTSEMLEGFDRSTLMCSETRVVAQGGVYACPILAGLPGAKLSDGSLREALTPSALYHHACVTCYETGIACKNF